MAKEDDDVWRAIVDNYGDRPELDADAPPAPVRRDPAADVDDEVEVDVDPAPAEPARSWDDSYVDSDWESDRFVPPPPPPLPTTTPDRQLAWGGVFGSPLVLLASLLLGIDLPELAAYALVGAFVGGFLYLVFTMTHEPRDPNDDGAVV